MSELKGLNQKELFTLKKSLGNENRNAKPIGTPYEVWFLIEKALEKGNSKQEIAEFLNYKMVPSMKTKITRHISLFKNLNSEYHKNVVYLNNAKEIKDTKELGEKIGYQQAYELSRFNKSNQKKVIDFIRSNKLSWVNIKSISQLTKRSGMTIEQAIEEIKTRRGISDFEIFRQTIDLKELSPKIFKMSQGERDDTLREMLPVQIQNKTQELFLGVTVLFIKLSDEKLKYTKTEKQNLINNLILKIKEYG